MDKTEAMTTLRVIQDCLADLPDSAVGNYVVQGGHANASGTIINAGGPASISARGGDVTVTVSRKRGQQMAKTISQLIDAIDSKNRDQTLIDGLISSVKQWGYIGAVVAKICYDMVN